MEWIRKDYCNNELLFEAEIIKGKITDSKFHDKNSKRILEFKNGTGYTRKYILLNANIEYLEYEGEFKDGIKNGKGKEYNILNQLVYEGEYLNGKKHGKGKEYDTFGNIKYEREYFNGERHGKGKEYDTFGNIIFEGEYIKGRKKEI